MSNQIIMSEKDYEEFIGTIESFNMKLESFTLSNMAQTEKLFQEKIIPKITLKLAQMYSELPFITVNNS